MPHGESETLKTIVLISFKRPNLVVFLLRNGLEQKNNADNKSSATPNLDTGRS